jgi:hypothetical protein
LGHVAFAALALDFVRLQLCLPIQVPQTILVGMQLGHTSNWHFDTGPFMLRHTLPHVRRQRNKCVDAKQACEILHIQLQQRGFGKEKN